MAKAKTRLTARAKATAACGGLKPHSVMDSVQAPGTTPVLFVKLSDGNLSLANVDDIERMAKQAREAALSEVQAFVVAHAFDTTVGRKIDDFITALLAR